MIIKKLIQLCEFLPEKDIKIGLKFIQNRHFEELELLVKSVLDLIYLNNFKENPKEDLLKLDEMKIMELYQLTQEYQLQII